MKPAALKARALAAARRAVTERRMALNAVLAEVAAATAEARAGRVDYANVRSLGDATARAIVDLAHAVNRVDDIVSGRLREGPW